MREVLTIIACLLIALLTAALVGPWLVDWNANRDLVEAQLSRSLGAPVTTSGDIELKLLPTPRLVLGGVKAAQTNGASFSAQRASVELAVTPLLRGEVRFIETTFEAPDIQLSQEAIAAAFASDAAGGADVQFERIAFTNGRLRVSDPGGVNIDIAGVDLAGEAASLAGPFKGVGAFTRNGEKVAFRFNTGASEGGRLRLKFASDAAADLPRVEIDGSIGGAGQSGLVSLEAMAVVSGTEAAGWRASGPVKLDAKGIVVDPLELRIGGDDALLAMSGAGSLVFGADALLQASFAARQFDADRLMRESEARSLVDLPGRLIGDANFSARLGMPMKLTLTTPTLELGGETMTDVAIDLSLAPAASVQLRVSGSGPGRSRALIDGKLEPGPAARFQGLVDASVLDVPRLSSWIAQAAPEAARRLVATRLRSLEVKGDMVLSAAGFDARDLALNVDRSKLRGAVALTRAVGGERARFFADVKSDALDIDAIPDLSNPDAAFDDTDLQLALEARAVRVTRFGEGMIDAGRIKLRLAREKQSVRLETLSLADIGGASLEANGLMSERAAQFDVRLEAQRLTDLSGLLQRIAPGAWSDALATRAVALSPARMTLNVDAARVGAGPLRVEHLRIDATARDARFVATVRPEGSAGNLNGTIAIDSPEASQLVRQLGFESATIAGAGRGRATANLRGSFNDGFDVTSEAQLAGSRLNFGGRIDASSDIKGELSVSATDAAPFLRVMTFGLPDFSAKLPVDVKARVATANKRGLLSGLTGVIGDTKVAGDLAAEASANFGGRRRVHGSLVVEKLSLPMLATMVLGPRRTLRPGELWSAAGFAKGLSNTPTIDIDFTVGQLALSDAFGTRDGRFKLSLAPNVLQISELSAALGDGRIGGQISLRRNDGAAALSGALNIANYRVDQRAFSGLLGGKLEFSSTGASPAALVAGLAGAGALTSGVVRVNRADADAPARVIAMMDAGEIKVAENDIVNALQRELDRGPLLVGDRNFDVTLANGVVRLGEADGVAAAFDLRTFALELRARLTAKELPKDWIGDAPEISVVWKGPLATPSRTLEASTFVNSVSGRAILQETARVEALEADIRERAFFSRRQRGLAFLALREREVIAWQAEQVRLAAEEDRRRAVEAARIERERLDRERSERERVERERVERERRAAEVRRRESEAARVAPGLPLQIVPGFGEPAAGR